MDALASKVGSAVLGFLDVIDASFFMPAWYSTFLDVYCYDKVRLGYYAFAVGFFILASCARAFQRQKARTFYELFPRTGGEDACKLCALLNTTMSHYDKTGRRT